MELLKLLLRIAADPLSHILLLVLLGWAMRPLRKLWLLAVLYFVLMSTPLVHKGLVQLWAVPDRVDLQTKYDAAVLLLGVTDYKWHLTYTHDGRKGYCNLNRNAGRVGYVLNLFRNNQISYLLLGQNTIGEFDETACVIDLLKHQGVDLNRIVVIGRVRRTLDEIQAVKQFLARSKKARVLMVTSSNHMRRALAHAQAEDLVMNHYATGKVDITWQVKDSVPASKWLVKNASLFYEMLAYLGYKLSNKI
ncbi:YdcF family protein [Pseudomonadota bacterium]